MRVFKRGNIWWYEFWFSNQRFQESTRQNNKKVAQSIMAARHTELAKGEVGLKDKKFAPNFDIAMKEFLAYSEQEHQAHPRTYKRQIVASVPLLKFFKNAPLNTITVERVEEYKKHRANQKGKRTKRVLRPATVNRELDLLRALFNYYIRMDTLVKNPVKHVKPLAENNEQNRVLTLNEQAAYLAECSQPLRDVAALLFETGMRPDEVYRMRVADVHLHVERPYVFNPYGKTKAAKRFVYLTDTAVAILLKRIQDAKGPFVFGSPENPDKPITQLNKPHGTAVKRSGVPRFRLYDCRHTFASRFIESRQGLVELSATLGHSKISMVQRYAHPSEEHKADAIQKMMVYLKAKQEQQAVGMVQ